jgi:hypothetical protein
VNVSFLVFGLVAWFVAIAAAHAIGKAKRRSGAAWGLLLGWIGVVIVALLPARPPLSASDELARLEQGSATLRPDYLAKERERLTAELETAYKECSFCKEDMRRDASVCRHCRRESEPWVFEDGRWRAQGEDGRWWSLVESTGEWESIAS